MKGESVRHLKLIISELGVNARTTLKRVPNVKMLQLEYEVNISEKLSFDKLKNLKLRFIDDDLLQKIEAPNLIRLEICRCHGSVNQNDLVIFLMKFPKLQKLTLDKV